MRHAVKGKSSDERSWIDAERDDGREDKLDVPQNFALHGRDDVLDRPVTFVEATRCHSP
jgi:hypothetical protein